MEEKIVKIANHEIIIHELTTEEESRVRAESQVWNTRKKLPETDQAKLDSNMIFYSVDSKTWPEEWGEFTVESIRKLPSKLTRKLLYECHAINVLEEDESAFLESQQQSQASAAPAKTPS